MNGFVHKMIQQIIKRTSIKNLSKKLVKFIKYNPSKKWEDKNKKQRQVTCYECGKPTRYKTDCPSLNKRKSKWSFYKTNGLKAKGCIAYFDRKEDKEFPFSSSCLNEDELVHMCLIARHKEKDLEVCDSDSHFKPSYKELSNVFQKDMLKY